MIVDSNIGGFVGEKPYIQEIGNGKMTISRLSTSSF